MKRYFLLTCFFSLLSIASYAQDSYGIVEEHKSALIGRLQKQRMLMGSSMPNGGSPENSSNKPGVPEKTGRKVTARGYRVQIYSGSSRSEAYDAQARFKKVYQDLNTYLGYEQPNYRVKVGDFTSRSQAQALMNQLRKNFSAVFIFTETVNIEY
ncbi:SPOR domain-containing protein [Olivibacter domesticus]|uniref:SPOR domain-containing protein n=1 Tax=Olivibacter domesticus TaxID=407022 RepID=UPI000B83D2EC|nr:SPOR domain-containing protein [Olivibacter domesticus]